MKIFGAFFAATVLVMPASSQPNWFAPDEASKQSLAEALSTAQKSNHRLIVMYDGGWCSLCAEIHSAAMSDPDIPNLVHSSYEMARVSTDDFAGLEQFAQKVLHAKLDKVNGLLITVLGKDGTVLTTLTAARLLDQGQLSTAKLKAALSEWLIGAPAEDVYRKAVASLPSGRAGWVEFRADWCGWCRKMEKVFQDSDAAPILAKYYSVITIDTEKNEGADALAKRLGSPRGIDGIPWFAVVDTQGKVLINSEGPKGNVGYPDLDVEVAHFTAVLKATAKGISAAEVQKVLTTFASLKK